MNSVNAASADINSPVGDGKAIDDKSGRVYGVIQIKELPDHTLAGTLIKVYPRAGETTQTCSKCDPKDPRYNKPIMSL